MKRPDRKNSGRIRTAYVTAGVLFVLILGMIGCSGNSVTPREGSIGGRILNLSGNPIEDALVTWAYDRTRWSLTDENGAYFIEGIGFGDQSFLVEAFGYRTTSFNAPIYSGQTTTAGNVSIGAKSFDYLEIKVDEVSATHAIVSWKTTDYTNGLIEFGEKTAQGRVVKETDGLYATAHSLKITGLSPAKQYFFKIIANREGREAETSAVYDFNTYSSLEDKTPPTPPSGVEAALNGTPGQITVFWASVSDSDLKGYKVYRSEISNGAYSLVSNALVAIGQERYTDYTVVPGKKYFYRVTSIDQAGNESGYNNIASMMLPGDIATEVRWTRANSPYLISGDISIAETGKIHIDPGVEILIAETDAFRAGNQNMVEFKISGAIVASAGNDLPIVFASARVNPDKGMWQGLVFDGVTDAANTLVNVTISDAVTGVHIKNSSGVFSQIEINNSTTGLLCEETSECLIDMVTVRRCPTGMDLRNNKLLRVTNSSFVHQQIAINSQANEGLKISGCNFLEYTETGLVSNETGGIIEFSNNLFVSPSGLGLKILQQSPTVEYNTFDSPYAVQLSLGNATIRKNLFLADRSIFGTGRKGIESLATSLPLPQYGPNNIQGFASDTAYIGCTATSDSTNDDVLLMKELSSDIYDYRLRQAFPDMEDSWGIRRESLPFEN